MDFFDEKWKKETESIDLIEDISGEALQDPYDVTFVSYNDEDYEYIRRYTTLLDPSNVENGIIENLLINDTTTSVDPTTGALVVNGGVGIIGNLNVGGGTTIAGITTITNTTQSTSKDTGALVVEGGVGIENNLYVGGNFTIGGIFISDGNTSIGSTEDSFDKDTGALVVEGGVGIEKNLNIGGNFTSIGIATINNSTSSISTTTGAFQVQGGVGVGENLNVGGNVFVTGISTFIGNVDFRGGTNGNIVFGDTSGDNVVFNADVNSNIIPNITNTYDLGSITQEWRNAYFSGSVNSPNLASSLRSNRNISGGGTITVDLFGNVFWTTRFIVISNGRGSNFATSGYFDINCPTSGTITGVGGASNKIATSFGISLGTWEALYYILPIGSGPGTVPENFRVVNYTEDVNIPHDWVLICVRNSDNGSVYFNNGVVLQNGESMNAIQQDDANTANTLVRRDSLGNFSAGIITATTFSGDGIIPAGTVMYFASVSAPTGFLKANGASLNTITYDKLFNVIGYTFGGSGTEFNLPDLRGEFIRSWDDGRGVDIGRQINAITQLAQVGSVPIDGWGTSGEAPRTLVTGRLVTGSGQNEIDEILESIRNAGNSVTVTPNDTRPRNIALLACIKY